MPPVVTVLYEDAMVGQKYPLHGLVLRMVEDDIDGETWKLHERVAGNPRKGIDKVLADLRLRASLIAGAGMLFALVDRDRVVRHYNQSVQGQGNRLPPNATDKAVSDAVADSSDAPGKVRLFFLKPNLEGLVAAAERCGQGQWSELVQAAKSKKRASRDILLGRLASSAYRDVRTCLRREQPGLDGLAKALGEKLAVSATTGSS